MNKTVIVIIFLFLVFSIQGCDFAENAAKAKELKRITLFELERGQKVMDIKELYPIYSNSLLFYRKNFIYFYDAVTATFYKCTKSGDIVLKIKKSEDDIEEDKNKYLNPPEQDRSTKIEKIYPLPEISDINVDFNDNIYLKVTIHDINKFLDAYTDKKHPLIYLLPSNKVPYLTETIEEYESIYYNNSNEEIRRYYLYFMKFNQYGEFIGIIALTENHTYFPPTVKMYHTSAGDINTLSFITSGDEINALSEVYSNKDEIFILTKGKTEVKNTVESLINQEYFIIKRSDIPKTEEETTNLYETTIPQIFINNKGNPVFNQTFYDRAYPRYTKFYIIDFKPDYPLIRHVYTNDLKIEIVQNNKKQNAYVAPESFLGISDQDYLFSIKYSDKKSNEAKLTVRNSVYKTVILKLINTKSIDMNSKFFVDERGGLYAFAEVDSKAQFFYWATDAILIRINRNSQ